MSGNSGVRLGLSIVGAVVGSFVGMPQLGLLVGSLLGSFLFPDKGQNSVATGSKVAGINLTTSTYGSGLTILYGTRRLAGNVLFNAGLRQNQATDRTTQGKGGSSSSQTSISYQYFWTGAIAFCEGVSARVLRIWANGVIVYDVTKPPVAYGPDNGGSWNLKLGTDFRFYTGNETQMPDPALVDFLNMDGSGAGDLYACPYRGISYLVFDDIPLEQFGNRIPNFEAEIAMQEPSVQKNVQDWTPLPTAVSGSQNNQMVVDWNRGDVWTYASTSPTDPTQQFLMQTDLYTLKNKRNFSAAEVNVGPSASSNDNISKLSLIGQDGFLYSLSGGAGTQVQKVNLDSLHIIGNYGDGGLHTTWTASQGFSTITNMDLVLLLPTGAANIPLNRRWILMCGGLLQNFGFLDSGFLSGTSGVTFYRAVYQYSQGANVFNGTPLSITETGLGLETVMLAGKNDGNGQCWMYVQNTAQVGIYEFNLGYDFGYQFTNDEGAVGFQYTVHPKVLAADIDPAWTGFVTSNLRNSVVYDSSDNSLIFMVQGVDGSSVQSTNVVKWQKDLGIVWNTKIPGVVTNGLNVTEGWKNSLVGGNTHLSWFDDSEELWTLSTVDGSIIVAGDSWHAPITDLNVFGTQVYDSFSNTILKVAPSAGYSLLVQRANLGLINGGEDALVSDIVLDLCSRVGLANTSDVDVVPLAALGYTTSFVILQPTPATDPLSTLAQTFFFAVTESDFVLKFVPRGAASVATIDFTKMAAVSPSSNAGDYFTETRTQDVEMPSAVQVNYTDRSRDYQPGSQPAQRPSLPDPTMYSRDASTIDLTQCVISSDYALQVAEKTIYVVWQERSNYVTKISWEFIYLDPTDVVTWQLSDGSQLASRVAKADIGADLTQSLSSNSEDTAHYVASGRPSDPGLGFPQQLPPGSSATRLFLFNLPLLRDLDDQGRIRSVNYWAAGGYGNLQWPGCNLYSTLDGQNFGFIGPDTVECKYGFSNNALADANPYVQDNVNTLNVSMRTQNSDLVSCTYLELMNGSNAALLVNSTTMEVEVIQYQTATQNSDGTWDLTGLLRGRRGTDPFTGIHDFGDIFIPLNANNRAFQEFFNSLNQIGVQKDFRAVGFGQLFENGFDQLTTLTGADLLPYAPTNLKAALSGSDIVLSWTRRTRLNGAWKNLTGVVPLNEDSEKYEVDILSGPGGTVLRTLTSITESVTYSAADIAIDFGSTPAVISGNVYQISAQVGRGRHRELTVDVV